MGVIFFLSFFLLHISQGRERERYIVARQKGPSMTSNDRV